MYQKKPQLFCKWCNSDTLCTEGSIMLFESNSFKSRKMSTSHVKMKLQQFK